MKKKASAVKEKQKEKQLPQRKKKELPLLAFLFLSFVILVPLILYLFGPCLKNGFSNWDDPTYLENNPLIKAFTTDNIRKIFTEIYFSNYQPLHIFSYLIEYQFFKLNPYGYHMVSILMHTGITVMVMWLALLLFENRFISIVTGLLFAIHPIHVESIAWAAERKDLLYAFFFFSSLVAYMYYLKNTKDKKILLLCFLLFTLSIFSKAMAASLPPVLVLLDFCYHRKFNVRLILEKLPFFILAVVMGLISVYASGTSGSINDSRVYTFFDRIILANANLVMYMVKLLVPFKLCSYYPYPDKVNGMLPWLYFIAPAGVAIITVLAFYSLKFTRKVFLCYGFFVFTVFLVLQLLPVGPNVFAERYSYIPSSVFFMLLAYGIDHLIRHKKSTVTLTYLAWAIIGIYSIWLSVMTPERCKVWKDPDTFWTDVIQKYDNVPIAYNNRGHFYNKSGRKQEALADFDKAILLNADYDMARFNRGSIYGEMGKFQEALTDLNIAIKLNQKLPEAYKMRGQVFAMTGQGELGLADFKKALALQPDYAEIYYNMGIYFLQSGNNQEACVNFKKADELRYEKAADAVSKYCKTN